jgi:hypothetical protein
MADQSSHHDSLFHKWFGPNNGTHWTIAGAVAVIILGLYVIYSIRSQQPIVIATVPLAVPAPMAPSAPQPIR